jgi:RHS repeat-associated protein
MAILLRTVGALLVRQFVLGISQPMTWSDSHCWRRVTGWLALATSLIGTAWCPATTPSGQEIALSVQALDLTDAPSADELTAAGQLGGPLYPTHESLDAARDRAARLDFGQAIEAWNRHDYPRAVWLFRKHIQDFADSPWVAEAALHIGCDATYNGRYGEAEALFQGLVAQCQGATHPGARMMLNKARMRLGLVKVAQNNFAEATRLFRELKQDSPDWKQRTYAAHWIQRLARYRGAQQTLLNCGGDALAYVLRQNGLAAQAKQVRAELPQNLTGHSLQAIVAMAARSGLASAALRLPAADLAGLPLPAIVQINARNRGDRGHYWVLEKVAAGQVDLFDPQSRGRFRQSVAEFEREWSGNVVVFASGDLPGRRLNESEMADAVGGCCGAPRPPDDTGDPCRNGSQGTQAGGCCGRGEPWWSVNMISMNFYLSDTPLWYHSPVGPSVSLRLSYNSHASVTHLEPFGNKWQFAYGTYLVEDTAGNVLVFMPDGGHDQFMPDGSGGYVKPYRVFNRLTKLAANHFELRFPDDSVFVYRLPPGTTSQQPFLTEIRDVHGQQLTLSYNASVQLVALIDALGRLTTFTYNNRGLITKVTDPFGRSANFEYDGSRNLKRITDMGGYAFSFTYDADVYLTSLGNSRGTWSFYTEPADGIPGETDTYSPPGDVMWENYRITVTDPAGGTQEFFYFAGCGEFGCGGHSWHVSPRYYIPWLSQEVNNFMSRPPKTRFLPMTVGNGQGEIGQIVFPGDGSQWFYYDVDTGDRIAVTDAHEQTWDFTYNEMGHVTSATEPDGSRTEFAYAPNGVDLEKVSNGLGDVVLTYNGQHDLTSIRDRLGQSASFAYNSFGQITSQVAPSGVTNTWAYDSGHRATNIALNGQVVCAFTYDTVGRIRTYANALGLTRTFDYNSLDELTRITFPDGQSESYTYSGCCPHLVESVTGRGGTTAHLLYDELKRLSQIINPEGGVTRMRYDGGNNLTHLTDPNGNVTTFTYDVENRVVGKTFADGAALHFSYDQVGLMTNRVNARGISTVLAYDANHRLLSRQHSDGTPGVDYGYDAYGRLVEVIDALGTNTFTYNPNSLVTGLDGPWANDTLTFTHDALGRLTNLVAGLGQPVGYAFDAQNRLTSVRAGGGTYTYTYAGISPLLRTLTRPNGSITTNSHDPMARLTRVAHKTSGQQLLSQFSYAYTNGASPDFCSSLTVSNGVAFSFAQNESLTYSYNRLNQMVTSAPPARAYSYDADGNQVRGYTPEGFAFSAEYDAVNQLTALVFTNTGGVVLRTEFAYNWAGFTGEARQYADGVLTNRTRLVRHGALTVQERDGTNAVTREFVWQSGHRGGIGRLLQLRQAGQTYAYLYDGRGNVIGLLDAAQAPAASYAYDPFGVPLARAGALQQPFRFSTKTYDEATGLSDYGHRFYQPALARWLTRDPIGERGGINLYQHTYNNPLAYLDPHGEAVPMRGGGWAFVPVISTIAVPSLILSALWDRIGDDCAPGGSPPVGPSGPPGHNYTPPPFSDAVDPALLAQTDAAPAPAPDASSPGIGGPPPAQPSPAIPNPGHPKFTGIIVDGTDLEDIISSIEVKFYDDNGDPLYVKYPGSSY